MSALSRLVLLSDLPDSPPLPPTPPTPHTFITRVANSFCLLAWPNTSCTNGTELKPGHTCGCSLNDLQYFHGSRFSYQLSVTSPLKIFAHSTVSFLSSSVLGCCQVNMSRPQGDSLLFHCVSAFVAQKWLIQVVFMLMLPITAWVHPPFKCADIILRNLNISDAKCTWGALTFDNKTQYFSLKYLIVSIDELVSFLSLEVVAYSSVDRLPVSLNITLILCVFAPNWMFCLTDVSHHLSLSLYWAHYSNCDHFEQHSQNVQIAAADITAGFSTCFPQSNQCFWMSEGCLDVCSPNDSSCGLWS